MYTLERAASALAIRAHGDQVRNYTGEPYWRHCEEVAGIVRSVPHTPEMLAAAWLHDTLEDTDLDWREIAKLSIDVLRLVRFLTDVSKPEDGNRRARKAIDRAHIATAWPAAKTVKLADLISNTRSIVAHDPGFANVYLAEKRALLEVLTEGDATLLAEAKRLAGAA
jgi:(p)ppGpp synthase/HD superfamily hydrolase